jgi:hypothetical protein
MALQVAEIVEIVQKKVEHRGEKLIDFTAEFWLMLQELLHENRFWWAHKTAAFNTVASTATYDLSSASLFTQNVVCFEQIESVWRITSPTDFASLEPILQDTDKIRALENTTAEIPVRWMKEPESWNVIRLGGPASGVYKIRLWGWANVDPTLSQGDLVVPLVPGHLHYGLEIGLRRKLLEFLFGQGDQRWAVADNQWQRFLAAAARRNEYTTDVQQAFGGEAAVQAY